MSKKRKKNKKKKRIKVRSMETLNMILGRKGGPMKDKRNKRNKEKEDFLKDDNIIIDD